VLDSPAAEDLTTPLVEKVHPAPVSAVSARVSQPGKHEAKADKELLATPVVRKLAKEHNV
jgi:pyruvate/2-oxoglutarate dehydrogenase complex dihydrolipoamide acyltransferase (E2) component